MGKNEITTKRETTAGQSASQENPYLGDPGLSGLLGNLACGGCDVDLYMASDALAFASNDRLAAIAQQADNVVDDTMDSLASLGRILQQAGATGEVGKEDVANVGWLNAMLADLVSCAHSIGRDAKFLGNNPDQKANSAAAIKQVYS